MADTPDREVSAVWDVPVAGMGSRHDDVCDVCGCRHRGPVGPFDWAGYVRGPRCPIEAYGRASQSFIDAQVQAAWRVPPYGWVRR